MAPQFENKNQEHTGDMLKRLEKRVNKGAVEETPATEAIKNVDAGIKVAKDILTKPDFDWKNKPVKEIADLSNAWTAWQKNGVFKGNQDILGKLEPLLNMDKDAKVNRFARQIWRTEMVGFIRDQLVKSERANASEVLEQVLASQIVTELENDPREALDLAQELDEDLKTSDARKKIAEEMLKDKKVWTVKSIKAEYGVEFTEDIKVVIGGELMPFKESLCKDFKFRNLYYDKEKGKIYFQMENGCKGNPGTGKVKPRVVPVPVDPNKPPVDPNKLPVNPDLKLSTYEYTDPKTHAVLIRLNPDNHWLEWTDSFRKLSPELQKEAELNVKQDLLNQLSPADKAQLQSMTGKMADPAVLDRISATITAKGAAASPEEADFLKNMDGHKTDIRNAQLLSLFETWLGVKFEDKHSDPEEQRKYDEAESTISQLKEILNAHNPVFAGKKMRELWEGLAPVTPGVVDKNVFWTQYSEFLLDTDYPFVKDFAAANTLADIGTKSNKAWLEFAKSYREQGKAWYKNPFGDQSEKFEQAEAILRTMVQQKIKPTATLKPEETAAIGKKVNEIDNRKIYKTLEERGMLKPDFWNKRFNTEQDFIDGMVKQSREELRAKLTFITLAKDENNIDFTKDPTTRGAYDTLQDMLDFKGEYFTLSDSTVNFLTKEAITNTILFAVSGGAANVALRLATAGARITRLTALTDSAITGVRGLQMGGSTIGSGAAWVGENAIELGRWGAKLGVQSATFAGVETGYAQVAYGPQSWDSYMNHWGMSMVMFGAFGVGNELMNRGLARIGATTAGPTVTVGGFGFAPGVADVPVGAGRAISAARTGGAGYARSIGEGLKYAAKGEARMALDSGLMTTLNGVIGDEEITPEQFAKNMYLLHFLWAPARAKPTEPKPAEPKPAEPKPAEPKPEEPKPAEPKPEEPKPAEPKPEEPKPAEPKPEEPKPAEVAKPAHDVDIQANNLAKNRFAAGEKGVNNNGFPEGTIPLGTTPAQVDNVLNLGHNGKPLKEHYQDALREPNEPTRAKKLAELDRVAAERLILENGAKVEYPTRAQADAAKVGLEADFPSGDFIITEANGKAYIEHKFKTAPALTQAPAPKEVHNVKIPSDQLAVSRFNAGLNGKTGALPEGKILLGTKQIQIDPILNMERTVTFPNGTTVKKPLKEHYNDKLGDPKAQEKVDHAAGELIVVENGGKAEYATRAEAEAAKIGLKMDFPTNNYQVTEVGGKGYLEKV